MGASSWREADLRGTPETPPASVGGVVRHARRGLLAARWGESVLLGVTGAFLTLASAVVSGAERSEAETIGVALLAGFLAAAAWRIEHRVHPDGVARRLDKRLRYQGALSTAYELEERGGALSGLEELVRRRVLDRLRPHEARRALLPPLLVPIGALVAAGGILVLALESVRPDPAVSVDVARLARGVVDTLGPLGPDALEAGESGALETATVEELLDVWNRVRDLERRLVLGDERGTHAEAQAVERELAELARRLEQAPELRERLEAARTFLDAARMGLAPSAPPTPDRARDSAGSGEGLGTAGTAAGTAAMTGSDPEGTMTGSLPPDASPANPQAAVGSRDELAGLQRSWPAALKMPLC